MFSRSLFHSRQFTRTRLVALCALLLIAALVAFKAAAPHSFTVGATAHRQHSLSFEERIATLFFARRLKAAESEQEAEIFLQSLNGLLALRQPLLQARHLLAQHGYRTSFQPMRNEFRTVELQ